jgi:hypothetical protein
MTSTTLFLASTVPASTVVSIRAHVDRILMADPDWSGAGLVIETGADYTCVDDPSGDAHRGASLLYAVQRIIEGEEGEEAEYAAWVGEIPNPCGFGATEEAAIDDAVRFIVETGGVGPGSHQWPDEQAVRDVTGAMKNT